jgi:uncharacterized membrane protein YesL
VKKDGLQVFWDGLRRSLNSAADLILLNFLTILCCAPVLTAGAALCACYQHLMRLIRGEERGLPLTTFFRDFRKDFRPYTLAWMLLLLCAALLAGDYYYAVYVSNPVNRFFLVFSIVLAAMVALAAVWLFPLMARFENNLKAHLKNALLMTVAEFPKTVLALSVQLAFVLFPLALPGLIVYLGWFWLLFGQTLPMYLTVRILHIRLGCSPPEPDGEGED